MICHNFPHQNCHELGERKGEKGREKERKGEKGRERERKGEKGRERERKRELEREGEHSMNYRIFRHIQHHIVVG